MYKKWSSLFTKPIIILLFFAFLCIGCSSPALCSDEKEESGGSALESETGGSIPEITPIPKSLFDFSDVPEFSGRATVEINDSVPFFTSEELTAEPFECYSPLDSLGRCGTAYACVGPETMPGEDEQRESLAGITPTGWIQRRYDGIGEEGWLYNRCHLIGFQLTGENANELDLITGTRYMNIEGMLENEISVAQYIEGTGNHVLYRVTPIFVGKELVARGVLMEARSIEDPLVQYCEFAYNVQPGITINYKNGKSKGPKYTGSTESDDPGLSASRNIFAEAADPANEVTYILNTNTMRFHYTWCKSVNQIKPKNYAETTRSRDELIAAGYKACGNCHP